MAQRILIIEDDNSLAGFIRWQLEREGFLVQAATRSADGLIQVREWHPDLIILDIMMPEMDGWTICQRIREMSNVPVIFMTALGAEKDVVRGLQLGADDYIVKPSGAKELVARIQAVLRRHKSNAQREHTYSNGKLFINLDTHQVSVDGQDVELTPIEFKLLACLAEQEGKVLTHRFLLNQVWGPDYEDDRQYLKLYIWYLRQKIEDDPNDPRLILTQRGVGYRLVRVSEFAP
jgi:two-component system KDP operon response regulator KdpE